MDSASPPPRPRRASSLGSRRALRPSHVVLAAAALGSCDSGRAPTSGWGPAGEGWGESAFGKVGAGGETGATPSTASGDVLVGPCEGEVERTCKAPAPHCLVGFQACVDGVWSHCQRDLREPRSDGAGGAGGGR